MWGYVFIYEFLQSCSYLRLLINRALPKSIFLWFGSSQIISFLTWIKWNQWQYWETWPNQIKTNAWKSYLKSVKCDLKIFGKSFILLKHCGMEFYCGVSSGSFKYWGVSNKKSVWCNMRFTWWKSHLFYTYLICLIGLLPRYSCSLTEGKEKKNRLLNSLL